MDFYDVEVDCMAYCYGGSPKFTVEPYGYGEWAKREDVDVLIAERDRLAAENAELREEVKQLDWKRSENKAFAVLYRKDLTAANATLDALRDAVPEGFAPCSHGKPYIESVIESVQAILYPQEPRP
jgi:hypothetical protein